MEYDKLKFSDLVGLIYDAAQNPELWPELLANLDDLLKPGTGTDASLGHVSVIPEDNANISLLRSHFQRALDLNNKIFRLQNERDAVFNILDRLPIGVVLVNVEQVPIAMNQRARKVLELGNTLEIRGGKLVTRLSSKSARLTEMIQNGVSMQAPARQSSEQSLLISSKNNEPCSIWVAPSTNVGIKSDTGLAAVFIASAEIQQPISIDALANMYSLTMAEARLLNKLVNGCHSLSEAADALNLSKHTVRSQMKSIMEKTDTHSQTELIKKVLSGPAFLIGESQQTETVTDLATLDQIGEENGLKMLRNFRLYDGRLLEFSEQGNPEGRPVIFLHSILHSRGRIHPYSRYAEENNIRLIIPERPGFGYSDLQPEQSLQAYPEDIVQLADHLRLEKFWLVGDAAGAPFALACAADGKLQQRLHRVAAISCIPEPKFDVLDGLIPFERMLLHMGRSTPASFHSHFAQIMMKGMQRNPEKYYDRMYKHLPDSDQAIVTTPEKRAIFMESIDNAFPSRVTSFVHDYLYRLRPWNFSPKDIKTELHLWHGTENRIVSIESAKKIAAVIPGCRTHFLEGEGHYLFISHWDQILQTLVGSGEPAAV